MKEIVPSPPPIVRNDAAAIQALFQKHVMPSYGRFDIAFSHGAGSYLYDVAGRRYLDFGGGIAATGQEKVKKGFEPIVPGFRHVPYNDLAAVRDALSPATVAILIEGIQGEGGLTIATPEYLLGLRQLCDEKKLLLFMDAVQD